MKNPDSRLLEDVVERIKNAVSPLRIIRFGSASRGEMNRNSDLDLLVVMPEGTHRRQTSKKIIRALRGIGVPKDVVIVTERDVLDYGSNQSLVLKPALEEGRELYAAG